MLTTIPFDGFYESIHSSLLDDEVEQLTQNDNGYQYERILPNGETEIPGADLWAHVGWQAAHVAYAKLYAEQFDAYFSQELGLKLALKFDELNSPREYNF